MRTTSGPNESHRSGLARVHVNTPRMFGDTQMSALADMIQAALMLKYNASKVG